MHPTGTGYPHRALAGVTNRSVQFNGSAANPLPAGKLAGSAGLESGVGEEVGVRGGDGRRSEQQ
ncbi:MAG: hypothetical protein COW34_00445 [Armatimonadetes bacterium CG17_big_fil_post_rev_8_21_14_2_50_66_6]|nr:MAG: hypothetical protein COW34_00445 [Armatimonadetes bacterium CG17_big_fil_post_rev_8_21_14_2_50_66_6]